MVVADFALDGWRSRDERVARHALLALWKRLQDPSRRAGTATALAEMSARAWRRLGLLLFSSDEDVVRAVVSILAAMVAEPGGECSGGDDWRHAVRQRVWQSEWREFVLDKLADCHARALDDPDGQTTWYSNETVALQLLVALRSVFFGMLRKWSIAEKDQVRIVDLLVDLTQSPIDAIACTALQAITAILPRPASGTDHATLLSVCAQDYLCESRIFNKLVEWLHEKLRSRRAAKQPLKRNLADERCLLVFNTLVHAARYYVDVAISLAQRPETLLGLTLGAIELTGEDASYAARLQEHAVVLLGAILHNDAIVSSELVGLLRLSGSLISISWLLGHTSEVIRTAAHEIFLSVMRHSSPRDLIRVLIEQGCIIIAYSVLAQEGNTRKNEARPSRELLSWVVTQLDHEGQQYAHSIASSLQRSTNRKLQRNILFSLLLLAQSSTVVRGGVKKVDSNITLSILTELLRESSDSDFATSLIAMLVMCLDKSSTLRLNSSSNSTLRRMSLSAAASTLPHPVVAPSSQIIFKLAAGERMVVEAVNVLPYCRRIPSCLEGTSTIVNVSDHDTATLNLLIRLMPLSPQQAAIELKLLSLDRLMKLLALANALDCIKCWHATSLALSSSLSSSTCTDVLEIARRLRHPALMHRAIKSVIGSRKYAATENYDFPLIWGYNGVLLAIWDEMSSP